MFTNTCTRTRKKNCCQERFQFSKKTHCVFIFFPHHINIHCQKFLVQYMRYIYILNVLHWNFHKTKEKQIHIRIILNLLPDTLRQRIKSHHCKQTSDMSGITRCPYLPRFPLSRKKKIKNKNPMLVKRSPKIRHYKCMIVEKNVAISINKFWSIKLLVWIKFFKKLFESLQLFVVFIFRFHTMPQIYFECMLYVVCFKEKINTIVMLNKF